MNEEKMYQEMEGVILKMVDSRYHKTHVLSISLAYTRD